LQPLEIQNNRQSVIYLFCSISVKTEISPEYFAGTKNFSFPACFLKGTIIKKIAETFHHWIVE